MGRAFDIGKYANQLARAQDMTRQINTAVNGETRDIETITAEIIQLKQDAGNAILGIGQRLIEAKAMLSHGEWLPWLTERVEFSERVAQRFMKLAREWSNPTVLSDLGATKALTLLALPPEEREMFMAENNVVDMTSRELEKAIRERDEARRAAEAAQADARSAEESRAKMEADMRVLEEIHRSAQEGEAQARDALAKAQAELKNLRERPVDVAVEVDREAVEKARAEAVAKMQTEVDKLKKALVFSEKRVKEVDGKRKKAEDALIDARKEAGANAAILSRAEKAEAELAEARRQLEAAHTQNPSSTRDELAEIAGRVGTTAAAVAFWRRGLGFPANSGRCSPPRPEIPEPKAAPPPLVSPPSRPLALPITKGPVEMSVEMDGHAFSLRAPDLEGAKRIYEYAGQLLKDMGQATAKLKEETDDA